MHARPLDTMWWSGGRRPTPQRLTLPGLLVVLALSGCGTVGVGIERPTVTPVPVAITPTLVPTPATDVRATQTRQAELDQLASLTAATATKLPAPEHTSASPSPPASTPTPRITPATTAATTLPASVVATQPASTPTSSGSLGPAGVLPTPTALPRANAVVPPGWKVYQTPTRQPPFAMAYPPDWTVEEDFNNVDGPQVYFRSPADPQRIFMAIQVDKFALTHANQGDEVRDNLYRFRSGCEATRSGLDVTRENTFAGMPVKSLGMTCDARGGLLYLYLGVGIGTNPKLMYAPWYFRCRAPYDDYPRYAETVFLPMLNSLTITPPTAPG